MLDIESQGLMDDEDMKYDVLEESIDVEEHELIYKQNGQHEASEDAECSKLIKSEGEFFTMSGHVQSEVSNEQCKTPVKMVDHGSKEIDFSVIKTEFKEEPEQCTEEMETHSFTCVEQLKDEVSEDKGDMQEAVLEHMLDLDSQGLMDDEDMKYEVLEESIDIEEHELVYQEDGQHEELDGVECLKLMESEGAVPVKKRQRAQPENIEDGSTLAPGGKNIPEERRTYRPVKEESSIKNIGTHMVRSTDATEISSPVTINTSMYTAINKRNVNINSDNDCTDTDIDVDNSNSTHSEMSMSNDGDDKYIVIRPINLDVVKNESIQESSNQHKQTLSRTGVENKQTETYRRKIQYECEICQRQFNYVGYFKRHIRIHTGERPFECEICQSRFKDKSNLNSHLRIHTGEKPFACELCLVRFHEKSKLNRHLRTHSDEKPFECEICLVRFTQKCNLKTHLRTHTGEKPFQCEICQRKFYQGGNLKEHLKTHTGERPFECEICKVRFKQNNILKTHLRTHTGEKPFECKICQRKFYQAAHLRTHLRTHTDEKLFECEICKVSFKHKNSLNRHLRIHTSD